ncbi:MAG: AMP-binding protein [Clostridium sp.]|nr:AMP-binding protein [Clostridium sp.]MDY3829172.1 AMP-binding protein [Clostridium sp.]
MENKFVEKYMSVVENERGELVSISFKNDDKFNFAYDVVDELAKESPNKLAMLFLSRKQEERRFSFKEMSDYSSKAANYFKSLGIKKGDKVMLVLKRHYQFWFALLGLHKIGAIAIPTSFLIVEQDFMQRIEAGEVKAIISTSDQNLTSTIDSADKKLNNPLQIKIVVGKETEGWSNFDSEIEKYSDEYIRPEGEENSGGDDPMLMFFTSGTTGYPKMTLHNFKYPLGHYVTAKYWNQVKEDGIHFTISDTGWGKAVWGKIYGQWLCKAAILTYNFDEFNAKEILKIIEKYKITTFCAPPTMYRVLIRMDLSKYDLSSLTNVNTAGEAMNPEVFNKFYDSTGLKIMEGFGQTETTLTIGNLVGMEPKPGSMGKPNPQYKIEILLPNGEVAGTNEEGEISIAIDEGVPDGLFEGYYKAEDKNKEVWYDGYYHTGDVAYKDEDGYIWYVGRVDDVIKSSGYRVGPFEIENEIMKLPSVLECAVTPVPDKVRGQAIKATIVLNKGYEPTEELKREMFIYFNHNLANYKRPRYIEFVKEMPKTTSGKIKRVDIKNRDWNK